MIFNLGANAWNGIAMSVNYSYAVMTGAEKNISGAEAIYQLEQYIKADYENLISDPKDYFYEGFTNLENYEDVAAALIARKFVPKGAGKGPKSKLNNADETSTLFRVQGGELPNASKRRFVINTQGELSIDGEDMLFVTFNDEARALQFLQKRGENAELIKLTVDKEFIEKIRNLAVDQRLGRINPGLPQQVDKSVTNNSFGIPKELFDELLQNVDQSSIQIIKQ